MNGTGSPIDRAAKIDAAWSETVHLADGTPVTLRLMRPEDRDELARSFERLSPASRYQRFHGARRSLSSEDLRYLTELDGVHHVAIVAMRAEPGHDDGEGLGVARFVVLPDERDVAEPALTVVDAFHRRGLGRVLLARLADAAVERGVRAFRASVLASNQQMLALLRGLGLGAREATDGDEIIVEVPLASHSDAADTV